MNKHNAGMTTESVLELIELLEGNRITVYVDGGWGVDALLGRQTRPHSDLDIAVEHRDVPKIQTLLAARGYKEIPRADSWECNFVLGDDCGHLIDIHSFTFDSAGNNVFGVEYPCDSLQGMGSINGSSVKCITPEWMVKFHTGYKLDENDYRDVKLLCQKYELELPSDYAEFEIQESRSRAVE